MRRARFLQQRAEEARIAAKEADDAYRLFLAGKYKRTYKLLRRFDWLDVEATGMINRASEGRPGSLGHIKWTFKARHRK